MEERSNFVWLCVRKCTLQTNVYAESQSEVIKNNRKKLASVQLETVQ